MTGATFAEWFARYGGDYDSVEAAREGYQMYLANRAEYGAIFGDPGTATPTTDVHSYPLQGSTS